MRGESTNYPDVMLKEDWMSEELADEAQRCLADEVPWKQESIMMFGRQVRQPRLQCWMGDADYRYSGLTMKASDWHPLVKTWQQRLQQELGVPFNSVLLNLYRDGHDYMGFHRDNEKSLGLSPVIASLSLGVKRRFVFKHRTDGSKHEYQLERGSLLVMRGTCQQEWYHALPKMRRVALPRINLTFRYIHP